MKERVKGFIKENKWKIILGSTLILALCGSGMYLYAKNQARTVATRASLVARNDVLKFLKPLGPDGKRFFTQRNLNAVIIDGGKNSEECADNPTNAASVLLGKTFNIDDCVKYAYIDALSKHLGFTITISIVDPSFDNK